MKNIEVIRSCKAVSEQDLRDQTELNNDEINLILGYVEGHGYKLYWENPRNWILVDTEEPENEPEDIYDIEYLIERVSHWNYEFLTDDAVTGEWRKKIEMDATAIENIQTRYDQRDGYYIGTPTVRELITILSKLPQDYRVTCCGGEIYLYRFEEGKHITIDNERSLS